MKRRRLGEIGKTIILVLALLVVVNYFLGYAMIRRTRALMKELIDARMLDVANTAAAMLDGDALKNLTAGEEDTPAYRGIYDALRLVQDSIELDSIYTVRDIGSGAFIFLVDVAEGAAQFGELVVATPALKNASLGTPTVDKEPYEDSWGRFYSAYSPVFDSAGRPAGIVAVDFSAELYEQQVARYTRMALLLGFVSLAGGALAVVLGFLRLRKRFQTLNGELSALTDELDKLKTERQDVSDETRELCTRVRVATDGVREQLDNMRVFKSYEKEQKDGLEG